MTEIEALETAIREDIEVLAQLREQESRLLQQIAGEGYSSATQRAAILSQMSAVEGRLHKNRKRRSALAG